MIAALLVAAALATPLQTLAARVRAAPDEQAARELLLQLETATSGALGLPDEQLESAPPPSLRASTLDEVLAALDQLKQRLPELAGRIESLADSWNLCAVGAAEYDLEEQGGDVHRKPAQPLSQGGAGLRAFGVLDEKGNAGPRCAAAANGPEPAAPGAPAAPHAPPEPVPSFASPVLGATPAAPGPGFAAPTSSPISGRAYLSGLLRGEVLAGVAAQWSPLPELPSAFVRFGVGTRLGRAQAGDPRVHGYATYGIGYDDWHDGTFSVQLNHFEPYAPERGLDLKRTLLNAGYKLPATCFLSGGACLRPFVYLETPLQFDASLGYEPVAGLKLTLDLRKGLFLLLGVAATLHGPFQMRWYYAGGRWSWEAWAPSLSYENWGPNTIPEPHFVDNGQITLGLNWSL